MKSNHTSVSVPLLAFLLFGAHATVQPRFARIRYLSYDDARPLLAALGEAVPEELRALSAQDGPRVWEKWEKRRDADIRSRLNQGDEDSLVNLLLFGTSFTRRPRLTLEDIRRAGQKANSAAGAHALELVAARADDLVRGLLAPGDNDRLLFARRVFEAKSYDLRNPTAAARVKLDLMTNLSRILDAQAGYARLLESARLAGDATEEFVVRSRLFKDRGLSSDTSLMPNFAVERALASIKLKGLLAPGSVRRIAIVGPGLDFTDKQDGFDFYPQQTIQPFAVIDSLLRLGLARRNDLRVTTLDLSPRVNDHMNRARARASRGIGYVVQLPRDERWRPELSEYWSKFGDQIGITVPPAPVPGVLAGLKVRAVKIRPRIVRLVESEDVNIVLQHMDVALHEAFDLIVATNILVYYDTFEQSLALANIERMLGPSGLLLSNNALLELPGSRMRSVGYETVVYSGRDGDGDHIVWYQHRAK